MDGLERDLEGQAQVARLSILSKVGREVAQRYGVSSVPTFLVFDGQGEMIGRHLGLPNRARIKALVAEGEPQ